VIYSCSGRKTAGENRITPFGKGDYLKDDWQFNYATRAGT